MPLFTIVDDNYAVKVFRSFKELANWFNKLDVSLFLDADHDAPATADAIKKDLTLKLCVRLYREDANDWDYKIEKHN